MRVSSNPNLRNSDSVSDAAEYQLAKDSRVDGNGKLLRIDDNNVPYHPNVVNTPPARIYLCRPLARCVRNNTCTREQITEPAVA